MNTQCKNLIDERLLNSLEDAVPIKLSIITKPTLDFIENGAIKRIETSLMVANSIDELVDYLYKINNINEVLIYQMLRKKDFAKVVSPAELTDIQNSIPGFEISNNTIFISLMFKSI